MGTQSELLPSQEMSAALYLVYFWNPISLGADRGRMTNTESRVREKRWSVYQGCRAGGALGRRKSHTGGKEGSREELQ